MPVAWFIYLRAKTANVVLFFWTLLPSFFTILYGSFWGPVSYFIWLLQTSRFLCKYSVLSSVLSVNKNFLKVSLLSFITFSIFSFQCLIPFPSLFQQMFPFYSVTSLCGMDWPSISTSVLLFCAWVPKRLTLKQSSASCKLNVPVTNDQFQFLGPGVMWRLEPCLLLSHCFLCNQW